MWTWDQPAVEPFHTALKRARLSERFHMAWQGSSIGYHLAHSSHAILAKRTAERSKVLHAMCVTLALSPVCVTLSASLTPLNIS